MLIYSRSLFAALLVLTFALAICAQEAAGQASVNSFSIRVARPAPDTDDTAPYTLSKGDNEFGFWAGGAFKATTAFGGLTDAEASDRKLFLAAFRYGRTLAANDSVGLAIYCRCDSSCSGYG